MREFILDKLKINIGALCSFLRSPKNKQYLDYLNSNIPKGSLDFKTSEKLYLFDKEIVIPFCSCGNKLKFIDYGQGYRKSCGLKICSDESRKQTNIKLYGVDNPMKNETIKQKSVDKAKPKRKETFRKIRETNLKRYGFENASQNKEGDYGAVIADSNLSGK